MEMVWREECDEERNRKRHDIAELLLFCRRCRTKRNRATEATSIPLCVDPPFVVSIKLNFFYVKHRKRI